MLGASFDLSWVLGFPESDTEFPVEHGPLLKTDLLIACSGAARLLTTSVAWSSSVFLAQPFIINQITHVIGLVTLSDHGRVLDIRVVIVLQAQAPYI